MLNEQREALQSAQEYLFNNVVEQATIKNLTLDNSTSIQNMQFLGITKQDTGKIVNCINYRYDILIYSL